MRDITKRRECGRRFDKGDFYMGEGVWDLLPFPEKNKILDVNRRCLRL